MEVWWWWGYPCHQAALVTKLPLSHCCHTAATAATRLPLLPLLPLPHCCCPGLAAGSTTSEGATAAVAAACEELVGRLQASANELEQGGKGVTWEGVVKGVCGWEVLTTKVCWGGG
jgi:hypothetical protein